MHRNVASDVIVVGLGPTGLMATAYLAQKGWRVAAIEKHEAPYGLPRAGHVDHEIIRFLQELGEERRFLDDAYPIGSYRWYNAQGDVLLEMDWGGPSASGYNSDYMMYQPVLEDALVAAMQRGGDTLDLLRGYQVDGFEQDASGVTVRATRCRFIDGQSILDPDDTVTVRGRYFLAADGARSATREALGIPRVDLGFNETWLDCDVRVKRPLAATDPHQICDPTRPIFISPLGKRHHRFEWAILPHEDPADFQKPETAWRLLAGQDVGPDDVEIVRQQVYTFEARVASSWRDGRVLLLGDTAHTMPPHMGQGACSGMRDSVNLAWKLDLVLKGVASDRVLDSYQVEREPHTRTWIDLSIKTGEISCTLDIEAAARRDALLLSGEAPPMPAFPHLTAGILVVDARGKPVAPTGLLFPQRDVGSLERSGPLDAMTGYGFRLIALDQDPIAGLEPTQRDFVKAIGARAVTIAERAADTVLADPTGFYREWMNAHGVQAVIVRPDHYIFGAAATAGELGCLVDDLAQQLHVAVASDGARAFAHG